MSRVTGIKVGHATRSQLQAELVRAIQSLQRGDVWPFLADLLTPGEVLMLGRRLRIARHLLTGKTYEEIAHAEQVSYSTIQLVDKSLQRGLGGYRRAVKSLNVRKRSEGKRISNETLDLIRMNTPGNQRAIRIWLDVLDRGEEK